MFWTPAFAGVTLQETFYEIIIIDLEKFGLYTEAHLHRPATLPLF